MNGQDASSLIFFQPPGSDGVELEEGLVLSLDWIGRVGLRTWRVSNNGGMETAVRGPSLVHLSQVIYFVSPK